MTNHASEVRQKTVLPLTEREKDELVQKICGIAARGWDAEVRKKKDGLAVYAIKKTAV